MQFASVSIKQVREHGRLDAGFHVALARLGKRVAELRETMDTAHVRRALAPLPFEAKERLTVLARGTPRTRRDKVEAIAFAITTYPHLAYAMIEETGGRADVADAIRTVEERIARDQQALEALRRLAAQGLPESGLPEEDPEPGTPG